LTIIDNVEALVGRPLKRHGFFLFYPPPRITMAKFLALPGFYTLMFLYLEPLSTFSPLITCLTMGPGYFLWELIPSSLPQPSVLDPRADLAIWQLANSYLLLCSISVFTLIALRDVLKDDPVAQERIFGAMLTGLAIADILHVILTLRGLPSNVRFTPSLWNTMTHGNITFCLCLFTSRISWFLGIGRQRYFYGQPQSLSVSEKHK